MSNLDILSSVNDRYQTAAAFHKESSDLFYFLGLRGYAALHKYQFLDETLTGRRVKKYIIDHCNTLLPDSAPDDVNLARPLVTDKSLDRFDVGPDELKEIIRDAMQSYKGWEERTLSKYQECAKSLLDDGDVAAYSFMTGIVQDVSDELVKVGALILDLQNTDFDPVHIAELQPDMEAEYSAKLYWATADDEEGLNES